MQEQSVIISRAMYLGSMAAGRPSKFERSGFGKRLFKARQQAGLSQMQVAEKLGVTQQTYAGWERRTTALKPEYIARLVDILNVSADHLLGRSSSKKRGSGPVGKARHVFEQVSRLPRSQQLHILTVVEAFVKQQAMGA